MVVYSRWTAQCIINETKKEERSWGGSKTYHTTPICLGPEWGPEKDMLQTRNSDSLHYSYYPPPATNQGQRQRSSPKKIWGGISNSMQLWVGIHWRDEENAGDPSERTYGSYSTWRDRQIGHGRTCLEPPAPTTVGWDIHPGSGQQTYSAHQRSPTHHAGKPTNTNKKRPGHSHLGLLDTLCVPVLLFTQVTRV